MTESFQKLYVLLNNYLKLIKGSQIKIKQKIIKIIRIFCSRLTLKKRHILRLRHLVITFLTKTLIIFFKKDKYIS